MYKFKIVNSNGKVERGKTKLNLLEFKKIIEEEKFELIYFRKSLITRKIKKIDDVNIFLLSESMYIFLESGLPLLISLDYSKKILKDNKIKNTIDQIKIDINKGMNLTNSFRKHEKIYPSFFISLINVGEKTGNLGKIFKQLSEFYKNKLELKKKLEKIIFYPSFLFILNLLTIKFLISDILPEFISIYQLNDIELPYLTNKLLEASGYLEDKKEIFVYIILLSILFVKVIKDKKTTKIRLDYFLLKVKTYKLYTNVKFIDIILMGTKSGLGMIKSLELSEKTIENLYIKKEILDLKKDLIEGNNLSSSMEDLVFLDETLRHFIITGDISGKIEDSLEIGLGYIKYRLEFNINRILGLIEPVFLIVMALFIGIILIITVLPMFKMIDILF